MKDLTVIVHCASCNCEGELRKDEIDYYGWCVSCKLLCSIIVWYKDSFAIL